MLSSSSYTKAPYVECLAMDLAPTSSPPSSVGRAQGLCLDNVVPAPNVVLSIAASKAFGRQPGPRTVERKREEKDRGKRKKRKKRRSSNIHRRGKRKPAGNLGSLREALRTQSVGNLGNLETLRIVREKARGAKSSSGKASGFAPGDNHHKARGRKEFLLDTPSTKLPTPLRTRGP